MFLEGGAAVAVGLAHEVGAVSEPADDADLTFDPVVVVGRGAVQCVVEELVVVEADVDGDSVAALSGQPDQASSQGPGVVMVKAVELEAFFLLLKLRRHGVPFPSSIVRTI